MSINMRNAFIRVFSANEIKADNEKLGTHEGDVVNYTKESILEKLEKWSETKKIKYYMIEHNPESEKSHFHIVIDFPKNSVCRKSTIIQKFPYSYITNCQYGVKNCVQYLIHMNNPEKTQYSWDDVITNAPAKLEDYKRPSKTALEQKAQKIIDDIIACRIKEYEINKIDPNVYIKFAPKIKNAFEYQAKMYLSNPSRNIQIIVIQGPPRVGKSLFCKAYADLYGKSIKFSSSSNDAWGDYYGEDVYVYDDFDHSKISITDFTKALDIHNNTSVKARYKNKVFMGDTIFICTNIPIIKWFELEPEELRQPIFDRISYVLDFQDYKKKFCEEDYAKELEDLSLSYEQKQELLIRLKANYKYSFKLENNVARYTINKIVNLRDLDEKKRAWVKNRFECFADRTLLSIDGDESIGEECYRKFDLNKYINTSYDDIKNKEFLNNIEDL